MRPVYISFCVWLINCIISHYILFLSDSVDERSWLDSKCLDTQSKCRSLIVHLLFNSSALGQAQLESQWSLVKQDEEWLIVAHLLVPSPACPSVTLWTLCYCMSPL